MRLGFYKRQGKVDFPKSGDPGLALRTVCDMLSEPPLVQGDAFEDRFLHTVPDVPAFVYDL